MIWSAVESQEGLKRFGVPGVCACGAAQVESQEGLKQTQPAYVENYSILVVPVESQEGLKPNIDGNQLSFNTTFRVESQEGSKRMFKHKHAPTVYKGRISRRVETGH